MGTSVAMNRVAFLVLSLCALVCQSQPQPETSRFCMNDQENGHDGYCIHFVRVATDFVNAEETCAQFGGHLAHITKHESNQFIAESARKAFGNATFWIGATRDFIFGGRHQWHWTNKSVDFQYNHWMSSQESVLSGGNCAQIDAQGQWTTAKCCDPYPFVCATPYQHRCGKHHSTTTTTAAPIIPETPTSTPTTTGLSTSFIFPTTTACITQCPPCPSVQSKVSNCELGWSYFAESRSCYRVYHNKDWPQAEAACACENAHLASIHSEAENRFVMNISKSGIPGDYEAQVWIGATSVNKDENYAWSDSSEWSHENWKVREPNNLQTESCVQLLTDPCVHCTPGYEIGKWNNMPCSLKTRAFVCKKAASFPH